MPICGWCSACFFPLPQSPFPRSFPLTLLRPNLRTTGCADLRIAVVSPFVDRQHGTERALAELLERLAYTYGCEVHLYAQRVEDLDLYPALDPAGSPSGSIAWHRVPALPGPHLLRFIGWIFLNRLLRWRDT